MAGQSIAQAQIGTPSPSPVAGKSAAAQGRAAAGGFDRKVAADIVSSATTSHPDGSTTIDTVFANGTRTTTTTPAPGPRGVPHLLSARSTGPVLAAQEQAYRAGAGRATG